MARTVALGCSDPNRASFAESRRSKALDEPVQSFLPGWYSDHLDQISEAQIAEASQQYRELGARLQQWAICHLMGILSSLFNCCIRGTVHTSHTVRQLVRESNASP